MQAKTGTKQGHKRTAKRTDGDPIRFMWTRAAAGYKIIEDYDVRVGYEPYDYIQRKYVRGNWEEGHPPSSFSLPVVDPIGELLEFNYQKRRWREGNWQRFTPFDEQTKEWADGQVNSAGVTPNEAAGEVVDQVESNPLSVVDLHRRFAKIETNEDIVEFAAQYGLLGREQWRVRGVVVEIVDMWIAHAAKVRALVELWDACQPHGPASQAKDVVNQYVVSGVGASLDAVYLSRTHSTASDPIGRSHHIHEWDVRQLERIRASDASRMVQEQAGRVDWRKLGAILVRDELNTELEIGVRATVRPGANRPMGMAPVDLLGAIYVLFAEETVGPQRFKQCPYCHDYFPFVSRKKGFCDDAHKRQYYRNGPMPRKGAS